MDNGIEKGGFDASDPNKEGKMTGSDEIRNPGFSVEAEKESSLEKSPAEVQKEISEKIDSALQTLEEIAPIVEANEKKIEEGGLTSPAELRHFNSFQWYLSTSAGKRDTDHVRYVSESDEEFVNREKELLEKVNEAVVLGEDMLALNGLREGKVVENVSLPQNIENIFVQLGFDKPWQKRKLSSLPELRTEEELASYIKASGLKTDPGGYMSADALKFAIIVGMVLTVRQEGKITQEEAQSYFEELEKWAGVEGKWNF